ncbi:hypothetical protein H310_05043 [Aphanomyces invadans]|uniref:Uncharacterized protein n=1 Tax=Aphanomyces invadans TaxID=157072 RepID=A0A024UB48_9STRA|nr:hypothetical protein H310_05043 [Aphanomyces invadans]ETW03646.1 hypothetical protein H310_05043 [Aphanomyces invadans]|eukprot:XP_008867875.1 hypothetical protein H310_05043 [Aphanomyces invadans]
MTLPLTLAEVVAFDNALLCSISQRDHGQVQAMLAKIDVQNNSDLREPLTSGFLEAAGRDASILKLFLDAHFDVDACDEEGTTALMIAARGKDSDALDHGNDEAPANDGVAECSFVESLANVQQLLAHGACVDAVDHTGSTALHHAVQCSGEHVIVQELVGAMCTVDCVDEKGYMALHHAARMGQVENVRLLLARHDPQDVNATTLDGESVLSLACQSGCVDVVNELVQCCGIDLDAPNSDLQTPLMMAVMVGSLDIVQVLVQARADVTKKDSIGMTALHHAACCEAALPIVECLVDANSDINNVDDMANSIMHDAAIVSSLDVALFLLKSGAASGCVNEAGKTPTMLAQQWNRPDMVELLESWDGGPP